MPLRPLRAVLTGAVLVLLLLGAARGEERVLRLASTTSTEQSGLFAHLLPLFRDRTGIEVRVVAVGTGQALAIGRRGDADALLVHDPTGEERFVAEGHGIDRRDVMFNDFVVVGPAADPAGIGGMTDVAAALRRLAGAPGAVFASRGDDSGTHRTERRLWREAGVDPARLGSRHRELGQGMGPTLNTAAGLGAYALADRATWASFRNRQDLVVLVEGDRRLFNPYASILVSPAKGAHVRADLARTWHEWLTGPDGQAAIASYRIDGQQVFFPGARPAP